jgi:hypothetical protein
MITVLLAAALTVQTAALLPLETTQHPEVRRDFYGATITIEMDATLAEVLGELARQSDVDVVVRPDVDSAERVSAHAQDAPWHQVLDGVLRASGLVGEWGGDRVLRVRPVDGTVERAGLRVPEAIQDQDPSPYPRQWDDWPPGREEGISRSGLSLAELRALLGGRIEAGEWYGTPYRACSSGDGSVWIATDGGSARRSTWTVGMVRPLGASLCREVEGVRRCLLVRRGDDGGFHGVEGRSGRIVWSFTTAPDEGQCAQLVAGSNGA